MDSPDLRTWVIVLVVQSIPYLSAVLVSVMSSLKLPAGLVGRGYRDLEPEDDEANARRAIVKAGEASATVE